jgi:selenocysteine lyase/cysteine desulfurase
VAEKDLPNQRSLFDIPEDVAYLNCAYMSPLLRSAIDAGIGGIRSKGQPWTITPTDFFSDVEIVRGLAGTIIGCDANDISLVPAASYGIATAMQNLSLASDKEILVLEEQFPSNVYTWMELSKRSGGKLKTVTRPANGDWTQTILNAINSKTALAALPHCHWTDGSLIDLELVSASLRKYDAALVLDATQSLGAMPLDLNSVQPDFLVAACYKWLLGPYSTGILYVAPKHQNGQPIEHGWANRAGSEDFTALVNYRNEYQTSARRFDMGERSNFALLPPLIVGFQQIIDWGVDAIQKTITDLTGIIANRAEENGLKVGNRSYRAGHFLGVRLPGGVPSNLTVELAKNGVFVSVRGDSVRITPHLYNNSDDIDRLFEFLAPHL